MRHFWTLFLLLLLLLTTGCSPHRPRYVVGVSQCSEDIWRNKLNDELRMGTYLNREVELLFTSADDNDQQQVEQIDSLIDMGIDLLIVAPNQVATVSPAIDRAYDRGIPVIVFDRKTNSHKYTAYIGADNEEMGRQMGEFVATQLHGRGQVLEVMGLQGSSPAIERHRGFVRALSRYPDIQLVASLQGDWTEQSAYDAVSDWLRRQPVPVDYVFGQNDRMALGARRALLTSHHSPLTTAFCGIDGLPGSDGGIQCVLDSVLEASYVYPTHGDQVLQLAVDILEERPYQKETQLMAAMVTPDNARVLLMQNEETERQLANIDRMHRLSDDYLRQLDTQRVITLLAIGAIILLLVVIVLFYRYHVGQVTLRRERVVNTLWNMKTDDLPPASAETAAAAAEADAAETGDDEEKEGPATSLFITRFKEVVEGRLADSAISVEDLAADMNISRVQLYRKVKTITGSSPVELLRTARLNWAYQLLLTTDLTVSEVAYQVGFTAPSYFTKCFKDEYGQLPGDIRK